MAQALEEVADQLVRATRPFLKPIAHFCLLSTFIEDGFRMLFQFEAQSNYMSNFWKCGTFLAGLFVALNLMLQLGASFAFFGGFKPKFAVLALMTVVLLQSIAYHALWDLHFFLRNLSVVGGLVLLLAESLTTGKSLFAGVPEVGSRDPGAGLQLAGRILIIMMYVTLVKLEGAFRFILDIVGLCALQVRIMTNGAGFVCCVTVGFKTKLASVAVVIILLLENFTLNAFWMETLASMRDFRRYDFFQTLSVIGGLLLVVALGPGDLSIDERKKHW